ncbi:MAG: hypothetical protein ACD_56C00061G0008 [uncultured bacterium]|nr:MAG: hypothetical protein ACD_56C00061G0008 [uncultured bacterium]
MSEDVSSCPLIIQTHWIQDPYSEWAEVAQRHGEPMSAPI